MLRWPKEVAAVPGHLSGFDSKRRPMRPSATGNFLKWPIAWKRLDSTDIALWHKYTSAAVNKLRSCYNKCIKLFLGYHRRNSLAQVFLETGLPTFDTVMHNSACVFACSLQNCANGLVQYCQGLV